MDEVDVESVYVRRELGYAIELRLALTLVVIGCPIPCELPHRRQLHALRLIGDGLLFRPSGSGDAPAKLVQRALPYMTEVEGADRST